MISISLDHEMFAPCFMCLDMFQCLLVHSLWELNRICILLLYENCINPNYVELIHRTFQVYYILLFFCLFSAQILFPSQCDIVAFFYEEFASCANLTKLYQNIWYMFNIYYVELQGIAFAKYTPLDKAGSLI